MGHDLREPREKALSRLLSRVYKYDGEFGLECWDFDVHGNHLLYGQFPGVGGDVAPAHRASWELHNGPIPPGMMVCHKCDRRRCVRPDHLFLGTARDNTLDAVRKGRWKGGRGRGASTFSVHEEVAQMDPRRGLQKSYGPTTLFGPLRNRVRAGPMMRMDVWIPEDLYNDLFRLSQETDWSRNALLVWMLNLGLVTADKNKKAKKRGAA